MKRLLRKALLIVILFAPLFINTDCKKQKRCGCRGDVLYTYSGKPSYVYLENESFTIWMKTVDNYYNTYTFCNPDEIMQQLEIFKYGEELSVSGNVYWDCNYVMQASNYTYQSTLYQAYQIYVTDIYKDMYGKSNEITSETLLNSFE